MPHSISYQKTSKIRQTAAKPVLDEYVDGLEIYEKKIYDQDQLIRLARSIQSGLDFKVWSETVADLCLVQVQSEFAHICTEGASAGLQRVGLHEGPTKQTRKCQAAELVFPIQAKGRRLGTLCLGKRRNGVYSLSEIRFAKDVCDIVAAAALNHSLHTEIYTDPLTGLKNRRYLAEHLSNVPHTNTRNADELCLVIADIDHFKKVNDTFGHRAGDAVLVAFARLLEELCHDPISAVRLGGEEFAVMLPGMSKAAAMRFVERLRHRTERLVIHHDHIRLSVTISAGVAAMSDTRASIDSMLEAADQALYYCKSHGRNRTALYSAFLNKSHSQDLREILGEKCGPSKRMFRP